MTISKTHCRKEYTGNGATLVFPYDFYIGAAAELLVYVDGVPKILGVDYAVSGAGSEAGGNVTFVTGSTPANNASIVILRSAALVQTTDLTAGEKFCEADIEAMSDKITRLLQELQERVDRAPVLAPSSSLGPLVLPTGAGKTLRWNDAGTELEAVSLDSGGGGGGAVFTDITVNGNILGDGATEMSGVIGVDFKMKGPYYFVTAYGADPTGVADSTAGIQASIAAAPDYSTIVFSAGTYKITQVVFDGRNLAVEATGASFILNDDAAGFLVKGVVTWFRVRGGNIVGDGVNRDGLGVTFAQAGWIFGNEEGAYVQNVNVEGVRIEDTNIGIKFAAGTGVGSGVAKNGRVINCEALRMKGVVGGLGYGFQFSGADGGYIAGCTADDCGRHGIYFAEGRDYRCVGNRLINHRLTEGDLASDRSAVAVARSAQVSVVGNLFDNCDGGALMIDTDNAGSPPDNYLRGVVVSGNVFRDSLLQDIIIGSTAPNTQGEVEDILISCNAIFRNNAAAASLIDINSGRKITIQNNQIDDGVAAAHRVITFQAFDGAAFSREIFINRNAITTEQTTTIQVAAALCGGASLIDLSGNHVQKADGTIITDPVELLAAATNVNLFFFDFAGYKHEANVNADATPRVAGVTVMTVTNSAPTNITNFDGGRNGQVLHLRFGDGNTTIKATNIYLAGAVDFTPTSADVLTLLCISGTWFEVSRSAN